MNLIGFLPRTAAGAAPRHDGTGLEQAASGALGMGGRAFVARPAFGSDLRAGE